MIVVVGGEIKKTFAKMKLGLPTTKANANSDGSKPNRDWGRRKCVQPKRNCDVRKPNCTQQEPNND